MADTKPRNPVIIITAAGRGMGAACARRLADDGARVVLMSTSEASIELARELTGHGLQGSVTEPDDLARLVERAMQEHGRIDGVVNNTGHPPKGDLPDLSDADWHAGLEIALLNVVRMARLVTPIMRDQGGGAMVNISAFGAVEPSLAYPISSALRAGLSAYVKLYAERHARDGIRMNNVLPGFIDSYDVADEVRATIPMDRAGSVDEIASTVAFLLGADAGYITGQNIRVDGGVTRSL